MLFPPTPRLYVKNVEADLRQKKCLGGILLCTVFYCYRPGVLKLR